MRGASIPHAGLVVCDAVFFEEHPELLLKRPPPMVLILTVHGAGFQPWLAFSASSWGVAPGWYGFGPLALRQSRVEVA